MVLISIIIVLAVIGGSTWYVQTRTNESFVFAAFAWAAFALLAVKILFFIALVALIVGVVYIYMKKPDVIDQVKDAADEVVSKVAGEL